MNNKNQNKSNENLTQRAYLNTITGSIDFGAKQIVGFILNPIVVSILGLKLYGIWKILSQLNSYMITADINVAQSLKLFIARNRTVSSEENLQKVFTASLYATIFFLPLFISIGIFLIWISPLISGVEKENFIIIRTTMALLVSAFIINQLFSLYESVLRGMNIAYKRMGARASITIIGGILTAKILHLGYGLPGIAAVQIFSGLLTGLTISWVVHKNVSWFKFSRLVELKDIKEIINLSGKFMLERIVRLFYEASDIILLGILAGPTYVAIYSITRFLMNAAIGIINKILPAVIPGFGKLIGEKDYTKLLKTRSKIITLIWLFGSAFGALICMYNKSFIATWIGPAYYSGHLDTFLIIILGIQTTLQQFDGSLINVSLDIWKKVRVGVMGIIMTIFFSIILIPLYHTSGLLIGLFISRLVIGIRYTKILEKLVGGNRLVRSTYCSRTSILCIIIIIISSFLGTMMDINSWFHLVFFMILSFILIISFIWILALNRKNRNMIKKILNKINYINLN